MNNRRRAFSVIELLVVVAVIGLLITAIVVVAGPAIRAQKSANTRQTMQATLRAIEQFATENPLRSIYDRKDAVQFGPFPPYQLHRWGGSRSNYEANGAPAADSVTLSLDDPLLTNAPRTVSAGEAPWAWSRYRLSERLWRDIGGRKGNIRDWVSLGGSGDPQPNEHDGNDDNRALMAYLKAFSPNSYNQVPQNALRPLNPKAPDRIDPRGSKLAVGQDGATWVDVLGIHDAWGVPLDYFLYVKLEWTTPPGGDPSYRVVERIPVLRSRGVDREIYDLTAREAKRDDVPLFTDPSRAIYSTALPQPFAHLKDYDPFSPPANSANCDNIGQVKLSAPRAQSNGWLRAVASWDDYGYRPEQDFCLQP